MVPSGSADVDASNVAVSLVVAEVNAAVGGWLPGGAVAVTVRVVLEELPSPSVTVRRTV